MTEISSPSCRVGRQPAAKAAARLDKTASPFAASQSVTHASAKHAEVNGSHEISLTFFVLPACVRAPCEAAASRDGAKRDWLILCAGKHNSLSCSWLPF
jgi:hypothetical protein